MEDQYLKLRMLAEMFWDSQDFRKAQRNKSRSGTTFDADEIAAALDLIEQAEKTVSKAMVRELRKVAPEPVQTWIRESPGVGEHLAAKLIGVIGDPYIASPAHWEGEGKGERHLVWDKPYARNLDKLWSYCGIGDPARKRRKGMTAEEGAATGNWKAKCTLRLIAEACVKQPGSKYEQVYRRAREEYEGRVHVDKCPQCKGSSEPGQPWRPGHQHSAALRKVAKEVLRDLWEAARDAHGREHQEQAAAA